MLYHASSTAGKRILEPHLSTHGKEYVYAIRNRVTAMCFGAPKDDFDILIDEVDGKPVLFECYPDALKRVYAGKACSLYTVKEDGFLQGQTGWESEMVSENPVEVISEEIIPDIYESLGSAENRGECVINRYSGDENYLSMLRDELSERIKASGISKEQMGMDDRFQKFLSAILDG